MANQMQKNAGKPTVLKVYQFEGEGQSQDTFTLFNDENFTDSTEINYERNSNTFDIYKNFTYNMTLLECSEEKAKTLACDYTCKRIISFVVTISHISFNAYFSEAFYCFKKIYNYIRKEFDNQSLLAVIEHSPNKGYHLHVLHVSTRITSKNELQGLCDMFSNLEIITEYISNNQEGHSVSGPHSVKVSGEHVKSPGGIFSYLQKRMLCVLCNDCELGKAFMYFKREYVFPAGGVPKVRKLDNTLNAM